MKKTLLYLLIFSYSVIVVKPVLPSIADIVAHIFWYSDHIATVHYEHGQYHVHIEYADAAKKGSPEKNNSLREDDSVNFHLPVLQEYDFAAYTINQNKFVSFSSSLPDIYTSDLYQPPKTA